MTTSTSSPRMSPAFGERSANADSVMPESRPFDLAGRVVLLATDGSPAAQAATRFAAALAERSHARIHVVTVVDTSPVPMPPPLDVAFAMTDATIGKTVHEQQAEALRRSIAELTRQRCDWPVGVKLGTPAHAIVKEASRLHAALVILGLQRHGKLERALNDETAVSVMQTAACPVIGVAPGMTTLPTRVVAAMDFSAASVLAAHAASAIMNEQGSLVLTYVPPLIGYGPNDGESVIHELGVQAAFERSAAQLARPGISIEHIMLPHELSYPVSSLLLEYASDTGADLIAAGSVAHSRVDRWMIGSVSTDLVRDGRRSVLIVPPRPAR